MWVSIKHFISANMPKLSHNPCFLLTPWSRHGGSAARKLENIKQQRFSHKNGRALKIYSSPSHSADGVRNHSEFGWHFYIHVQMHNQTERGLSLDWIPGKNPLLGAVTPKCWNVGLWSCPGHPQDCWGWAQSLPDLSSALPTHIPSLPASNKVRTKSVVFCLLSLEPPFLSATACSLFPKKPSGFLLCPSLFLIPTFIHSSLLFFYPAPIFTFLAHIFLPKSLYFLWISHFILCSCIKFPLKSPRVVTTSTIFLSNPYSAVLFPTLVFSSHHPSAIIPSLSLSISLSPPPLQFSPQVSITQPRSFSCISQHPLCCSPTSLPLLFHENPRVCSLSWHRFGQEYRDNSSLHPKAVDAWGWKMEQIRALICYYSENQLQGFQPKKTFKESKSSDNQVWNHELNELSGSRLTASNSVNIRHNSPASEVIKILIKPRRCWDKSTLRWHTGCAYILLI